MTDKARLDNEALDWVIRLGDPRFADWDALTAWLALSPDHARAFDILQLAEAKAVDEVAQGLPPSRAEFVAVNDNPSRRYLPAGIAAGVAVLVGLGLWLGLRGEDARPWQEYRTAAGVHRDLRLADGTRLALNGDTVVRLDPGGRGAALVSGEALFVVRHDAARPFVVTAGGATITDLGTRFDVVSEPGRLAVSVAEGSVAVAVAVAQAEGEGGLVLTAGQGFERAGTRGRRFDLAPEGVAGWREGRLHYEDAPVSLVLADVARATGLRVELEGQGGDRRFTGTIGLDGPPEAVKERVRLLLSADGDSD
ncbi:Fe2+-dicitrate sensor membrane component [Novosphingobium resinovorum]|uniref:Fe2+-dicitrate sensor membrane component n=1 Tax=Novosphingobium resinovorum TaxID=158500 RepID=A0A031JNL5_9SPHN|nr:FecR domain-containing protein [Novosphingobium resinovorum]EZP74741.1 Fe2+-dicitrate sensor membrane component [Novosphingobium resinovorum]